MSTGHPLEIMMLKMFGIFGKVIVFSIVFHQIQGGLRYSLKKF